MDKKESRRSFFGKTAIAGGVALAAAENGFAAKKTTAAASQKKTTSVELMNVGAMCVGEGSHMNYGIWAPTINPTKEEPWYGRTTGMRISHCWDRGPRCRRGVREKIRMRAGEDTIMTWSVKSRE